VDTYHHNAWLKESWDSGKTRRVTLPVSARDLPRSGAYAARVEITRFVPVGTAREEHDKQIADLRSQGIPEAVIAAVEQSFQRTVQQTGIDPDASQRALRGEAGQTATLIERFRVEDFSSVLTFGVVLATLAVAIATVVLAVITQTA
jgi:hypothetical protein